MKWQPGVAENVTRPIFENRNPLLIVNLYYLFLSFHSFIWVGIGSALQPLPFFMVNFDMKKQTL